MYNIQHNVNSFICDSLCRQTIVQMDFSTLYYNMYSKIFYFKHTLYTIIFIAFKSHMNSL